MVSFREGFTPRTYQEVLFQAARSQNTLIVLPTGLGKTAIAAMLALERKTQYPQSKVLFLAPTKPLAEQHHKTFLELLDEPSERLFLFTGNVSPKKRQEQWEKASFVFSTPQGFENDVMSNRLSLKDVSLLVFDEAHRATGDYSYSTIAKYYHEQALHERVLALTASPGSDQERITQVCENLFVERVRIKSSQESDVQEYVQDLQVRWHNVSLSDPLIAIQYQLTTAYKQRLTEAMRLGVITERIDNYTKGPLLKLQSALMSKTLGGEKSFEVLKSVSLIAEALKLQHALELCETQTIKALEAYLSKLVSQSATSKTKAVQNVVKDVQFKTAHILSRRLLEKGFEHPKIDALKELITKALVGGQEKFIVFTQFRDTALAIKEALSEVCSSELFVGQAKKGLTGMSQKKQQEIITRFRNGEFSALIATSVAEEGLDIPSVDHVIFYEPVPSAIRTVQRRGRTGRHSEGQVTVLVSAGTRDEAYRWSAHHKEKRMYAHIKSMNGALMSKNVRQERVVEKTDDNGVEQPPIIVDYREKGSAVMKALIAQGARIDLQQLRVGDYQFSDVAVEYKTVRDFVDSLIDGRLLSQLRELRSTPNPLLIIEGSDDLYAQRKISPASINGMIATIIQKYKIPLLRTLTAQETAGVLVALARQSTKESSTYYQHANKPSSLAEQQEFIVASLPSIGTILARPLLEHFGSVLGVLTAEKQELQQVPLIGQKKADAILDVLRKPYKKA